MKALAVIPSIGLSGYLPQLVKHLQQADITILIVCNHPTDRRPGVLARVEPDIYLWRPTWRGIYRQWNLGLRYGALCNVPTLVLNDDVEITTADLWTMVYCLHKNPTWGILGFDYQLRQRFMPQIREVRGTFRQGGVGGFAFGVNPRRAARVDTRFLWWGGDDDLVARTERVGILDGCHVRHPEPSLSANQSGHLLPDRWVEHDRALLVTKYGASW